MIRKVRFCVVGSGRAGMVHALNLRSRIPHAELVAVADAERATLSRAARELELDRMYTNYVDAVIDDGVDAICISAPVFTHAEIAIAAADAGKHVFCEKPMALSLE
ncbi:MAG: Gfo/Idh/MocA family oxidoreductase, partial [Bacillota bacterium]